MSALPEGAILTTIDGRKCTAVPRNISITTDDGLPSATANLPSSAPNDDPQEENSSSSATSIGGILVEEPFSSTTSSILPISSSSSSAVAVSTSPGLRIRPSDKGEAPAATSTGEARVDGPVESSDPIADEEETEGNLPVSTSDGVVEETGASGEPSQATPTEDGVVISTRTRNTKDATTQITEDPTPAGRTGGEGEEVTDETRSGDSPEETSGPEDDESNDETVALTETDGSPGAAITTTLDGGVVTTIPHSAIPSGDNPDSPGGSPNSDFTGSESQNDGSVNSRRAGVIAGSVVGAVAAVALIAIFIWFWKKRSQRHKYAIQTPVFEPPNSGRTDKTWEFDSGSVGPTPRSARIAEAVGYKFSAIGKMLKPTPSPGGGPGVNMNRGNSQFMASTSSARANEDAAIRPGASEISATDRLGNWWSRVREDASFNWRLRNGGANEISHFAGSGAVARGANGGSSTDRRGSDSSAYDFSGALGLMLNDARTRGNDPFSDTHAVQQSQRPRANPFDDSHQAVAPLSALPQTTYDPRAVQRPRGSTAGSIIRRHQSSTPPSRTNIRSDQFDLEIDPHPGTRVRGDSLTSRVSSLSDWTEPGPDVGRAALNWAERGRTAGVGEAL